MSKSPKLIDETGRFAYEGLDRVIHEKARLGILTGLLTHPAGLLFNDLKALCTLTDGNLSRHLQLLEEAGLIQIWKGLKDKRSQTLCRITPAGKARFREYLNVLEHVIADAIPSETSAEEPLPQEGWSPV